MLLKKKKKVPNVYSTDQVCMYYFLRATVVKKYKTYWVKIPGPVVSQPNAPFPTTPLYVTSEAISTSHSASYLTKPVSNYEPK